MIPYPTLMIIAYAITLLGTPRVKKCRTCRYRWPVWESSIMMAAIKEGNMSAQNPNVQDKG